MTVNKIGLTWILLFIVIIWAVWKRYNKVYEFVIDDISKEVKFEIIRPVHSRDSNYLSIKVTGYLDEECSLYISDKPHFSPTRIDLPKGQVDKEIHIDHYSDDGSKGYIQYIPCGMKSGNLKINAQFI